MTEDREFEGKDLEEALAKASEALGIVQEDLHYEMLDAGRRGLLGLGVKNVHIRVSPPLDPELPDDEPAPATRIRAAKPKKSAPEKDAVDPVAPALIQDVQRTVLAMVEGAELDLEVEGKAQDGGIAVQLKGPDQKLLKSRNAELLSAIQFLLNRMSRRAWPGVKRISVSTNGPSRPRDEELVSMARTVAKQVTKTGKTQRLRPMNAYERRLVHLTVREFGGLSSNSDGKGALKRVRISKVQNQI